MFAITKKKSKKNLNKKEMKELNIQMKVKRKKLKKEFSYKLLI